MNVAAYQPPFVLTAKLNRLTLKMDHPKLTPMDNWPLAEFLRLAAGAK